MGKATWIKVGLVWKQVTNIWRKDGVTWKDEIMSWYKDGATWKDCMVYISPTIDTDKGGITASWEYRSDSDFCAIDVTPDSMSTTITAVNTGDGISWASILPDSGTGDYSFKCRMLLENGTTPRSMICRISDDASEASDVDVTLTQQPQPV